MAFTDQRGRTQTSLSEINVTPLVDVMLVLLVIFMVTAPILQTGIEVNLPKTQEVRAEQPNLHADITRVFADGDYVILDVHMIRHPGDRGLAIAEIYRVQDGKLAEHWDRIQGIPEKSKNANGLF